MEIEYLAHLFEDDELVVRTSVAFGTTCMTYNQFIERGQEVASRQKLVTVAVDSEGNKVPWPEEFKEAFKG